MRRNPIFRNMERVEDLVNRARYDRTKPRKLTTEDYDDFDRAGTARRRTRTSPHTIKAVKTQLRKDNFVRFMRLQSDVRWARRRLVKMGRNPDDLWSVLGD